MFKKHGYRFIFLKSSSISQVREVCFWGDCNFVHVQFCRRQSQFHNSTSSHKYSKKIFFIFNLKFIIARIKFLKPVKKSSSVLIFMKLDRNIIF